MRPLILAVFARPTVVALAAAAAFTGCGSEPEKEESLVGMIPPDDAVVIIDEKYEVSGAWLRNTAVSQEALVRTRMQGMPFEIDQHSLIRSTRELLTKLTVGAIEARRRGLTVSDQELSDRLAKEVAQFESTEQWRARLEAAGMTPEERRTQLETEMLFERYRDEVVKPRVMTELATPENARKFYEMHPELWQEPLQIHLFHIHRTVAKDAPESERASERAKIDEALRRIRAGETFEDVAREVSTDQSALRGGDNGWVSEMQANVNPELRDASFALKAGETSGVIESAAGFHVFQVRERKERRKREFEEVLPEIRERFASEALTREMEKELAQLRQQMDIKYLDLRPYIGEPPAKDAGTPAAPAPAAAPAGAPLAPAS